VVLAWTIIACITMGLLALTGFNWIWVALAGVLLGMPSILLGAVFGLGFAVFSFLSKAYLTNGVAPREAIRAAYRKFKADRWRVAFGLLVAFLAYMAASALLRAVLGILSLIPILGLLFSLLDSLGGIALTILMIIFLSGLSVAYLQNEAKT
jgi:hypothetical protein